MSVVNLESMGAIVYMQEQARQECEDRINRVECSHQHKGLFELCIGEVQSGRSGLDSLDKCFQLLEAYPLNVDQDFADRRWNMLCMSSPGHAEKRLEIVEVLRKNSQEIAGHGYDVRSVCRTCVGTIEALRCKLICMLIERGYRPAYGYASLLIHEKRGLFVSSLNKAIVRILTESLHNKHADGFGEDIEMFEQAKKNDASVPAES